MIRSPNRTLIWLFPKSEDKKVLRACQVPVTWKVRAGVPGRRFNVKKKRQVIPGARET